MRISRNGILAAVVAGAFGALLWAALRGQDNRPSAPPSLARTAPAAPGPARSIDSPPHVRIEPGSAPKLAEVRGALRGRLLDPTGRPSSGARVFLFESPAADLVRILRTVQYGMPILPLAEGRTGSDGSFLLAPSRIETGGSYEFRAVCPGYPPLVVTGIALTPREETDLGDLTLRPGSAIRGRVLIAGAGLPVPQARIHLRTSAGFEDLLSPAIFGPQDGLTAETDASGFYELRSAPRSGLVSLSAEAPGFARQIRTGIELTGDPVQVDFALRQGFDLEVRVADVLGSPIRGARVQAWPMRHADAPPFASHSDENGRLWLSGLSPGPYRIVANAENHREHRVELSIDGPGTIVPIRLAPAAAAAVRVLDPRGRVVERFRAGIRRVLGEGSLARVLRVPDRAVRPSDLDEGYATFGGLDAGPAGGADPKAVFSYAFEVEVEGFAKAFSEPFSIPDGGGTRRVDVRVDRGATLLGLVVDERGLPVPEATVLTEPDGYAEADSVLSMLSSMTPDRVSRARARTGAAGRFRIPLLAPGRYQLRITSPDFCELVHRGVEIDSATEVSLPRLSLVRGALVSGIAYLDGRPSGQILVLAAPADSSPRDPATPRWQAISGPDGRFSLPRRLPPGIYDLRAAHRLGDHSGADFFRQLQQLRSSSATLTVLPGQDLAEIPIYIATQR
ncbi:MAG: hypothetical protein Fur0037_20590 [Planctomycetota bacterium]